MRKHENDMNKLNDLQIRGWIKSGERFEGKSDGGGLSLRFRQSDDVPSCLVPAFDGSDS